MTPEWPEESAEHLARQAAIGQNGNDGYVYRLIAPHENLEVRLVLSGSKPLGTIELSKDPEGFALAIALGGTSMLVTRMVNVEGRAEVAFVKPKNKDNLRMFHWLTENGVKEHGLKEYHRQMGRLYGYSEASIEEFINAEIQCDCHKCKGK